MGTPIKLVNITPDSLRFDEESNQRSNDKNSKFDAKNYLNVRLDEENGETKKELTIRLLPMDLETGNPFYKVHVHNVKVPKEVAKSGFKSYICLSKTEGIDPKFGNKCPFCELNKEAYEESLEETNPAKKKDLQALSIANHSREAYIVRCIERGKENEGVKFWKFNARFDGTDPHSRIMDLYKRRWAEGQAAGVENNILDLYNGRDLTITITQGTAAPTITDASIQTPLSKDEEQMRAWVYDEKKWSDVFGVKTYDYLSLISVGQTPWYDRETGKWVSKEEFEGKSNEALNQANTAIKEAESTFTQPTSAPAPTPVASLELPSFEEENNEDDLPF